MYLLHRPRVCFLPLQVQHLAISIGNLQEESQLQALARRTDTRSRLGHRIRIQCLAPATIYFPTLEVLRISERVRR